MKQNFERKELKYLLTKEDYEILQEKLALYLTEDQYGLHTILSLYYDTVDFQLVQKSLAGPAYKEKFRVRSYGLASEEKSVFLELKKKVQGVVYKRRAIIPYSDYPNYDYDNQATQINREIAYLFEKYHLQPKILISYDRRAYLDKENPDFRVTFDFRIRYRTQELNLEDSSGLLIDPKLYCLMEVKALGSYPLWFSQLLSTLSIFPGKFSKYARAYQEIVSENEQLSLVKNFQEFPIYIDSNQPARKELLYG